jgi:hypothetical protein
VITFSYYLNVRKAKSLPLCSRFKCGVAKLFTHFNQTSFSFCIVKYPPYRKTTQIKFANTTEVYILFRVQILCRFCLSEKIDITVHANQSLYLTKINHNESSVSFSKGLNTKFNRNPLSSFRDETYTYGQTDTIFPLCLHFMPFVHRTYYRHSGKQ